MRARHEVVRGSVLHVKPLAHAMRKAAYYAMAAQGHDPRAALRRVLRNSVYCRTALIDGKAAAMWGIVAPLLGEYAYVWLIMSDGVTSLPLSIVREAKAQLEEMMKHYSELTVTILPDDEAALRFAVFLGFHDHHDDELRPRKEIEHHIRENPEVRVPIGESYVIALGYHPGVH